MQSKRTRSGNSVPAAPKRRKRRHSDDSAFILPGFEPGTLSVDRQTVNASLTAVSRIDGQRLPLAPSRLVTGQQVSRDTGLLEFYRVLCAARAELLETFTLEERLMLQQRSLVNQATEPHPVEFKRIAPLDDLATPPVIDIDDNSASGDDKGNDNFSPESENNRIHIDDTSNQCIFLIDEDSLGEADLDDSSNQDVGVFNLDVMNLDC